MPSTAQYAAAVPAAPVSRRVLVAEDEALIRLDLAEMLAEEGYEVVGEAADGATAVRLAEELRPDLVVMDVKMPVLDGISAAERIVAQRIAPVLILTAFSQRELVERARAAGAMAYLVKPFVKADLMPAIEMALSRHEEITQLEQEVADLTDRLETRKLVDRAKGLLQTRVRVDRARCLPVDPESRHGQADVDARGRPGRHRGDVGGSPGSEAGTSAPGAVRVRAAIARRLAAMTAAGCVLAGCSSIGDLLAESDEGEPADCQDRRDGAG